MTLDARFGEIPESFYAPDGEVTEKTECGDPATVADAMPLHSSSSLCETALKVLTRDSQLRRAYVQRRWQGLVVQKPTLKRHVFTMSEINL
jgi:hypothetical protein